MKKIQRVLRYVALSLLIVLAATGIGITGAIFNTRERYRDKEITIEQVDRREDDTEEEEENAKT
ncbi:MAG: hypothetical protein KDC99_06335 [Cyclobacteriaceae bacterium]|nr:hypothetical protein [Cyclobacteriaceae bacterium]